MAQGQVMFSCEPLHKSEVTWYAIQSKFCYHAHTCLIPTGIKRKIASSVITLTVAFKYGMLLIFQGEKKKETMSHTLKTYKNKQTKTNK